MNFNLSSILHDIALVALPLIFAVTLHEAAHGWIANKLGDRTAFMMGRVTLNPIKHIDIYGTIVIPILMLLLSNFKFLFGWAKPVPVTWSNLRHPRRDMALVALAGPFANFIMALIWAGIAKIALFPQTAVPALVNALKFFAAAGIVGIQINCILLILNLVPIPPLDGSRVVSAILPPRLAYKYDLIEPYGIWILLGLIFVFGRALLIPVSYLAQWIMQLYNLA